MIFGVWWTWACYDGLPSRPVWRTWSDRGPDSYDTRTGFRLLSVRPSRQAKKWANRFPFLHRRRLKKARRWHGQFRTTIDCAITCSEKGQYHKVYKSLSSQLSQIAPMMLATRYDTVLLMGTCFVEVRRRKFSFYVNRMSRAQQLYQLGNTRSAFFRHPGHELGTS